MSYHIISHISYHTICHIIYHKTWQRVSTNYMVFLRTIVHTTPKLQFKISFWVSVICDMRIVKVEKLFINNLNFFYVCGSVHRASVVLIIQQYATSKWFIIHFVTFYMFRVTIPPIIRSTIAVSATSGISRLHVA